MAGLLSTGIDFNPVNPAPVVPTNVRMPTLQGINIQLPDVAAMTVQGFSSGLALGEKIASPIANWLKEQTPEAKAEKEFLKKKRDFDLKTMDVEGGVLDMRKQAINELTGVVDSTTPKELSEPQAKTLAAVNLSNAEGNISDLKKAMDAEATPERKAHFQDLINTAQLKRFSSEKPTLIKINPNVETPNVTRGAPSADADKATQMLAEIDARKPKEKIFDRLSGKEIVNPEWKSWRDERDDVVKEKNKMALKGEKGAADKKKTDAEVSFLTNASEITNQLNQFEDAINTHGSMEWINSEGNAKLSGLPYKTAILYSKIVDPATAAREGEVEAAKKYLIATGVFTRPATALSSIENQKREIVSRIESHAAITGEIPPNLPKNFLKMIDPNKLGKGREAYEKEYGQALAAPDPTNAAAPQGGKPTATVSSKEEFDKLPHDTWYTNSRTGKVAYKP